LNRLNHLRYSTLLRSQNTKIKIIDAFPFFNEIDTLKLRLSLLYEAVELFVICESNITHSGLCKPHFYLENALAFLPWSDKILLLKYEPDVSCINFADPSTPWLLENGQRNFISNFLVTQNPDDIAVICDVDEIWNPDLSGLLRSGQISCRVAKLEMQFHYYYLNCFGYGDHNSKWQHPFFSRVDQILSSPDLSQTRVNFSLPVVDNAGWHFSYLGGAELVSMKISSFAHQETNVPEINNLMHLKRCIDLGIDHLNRLGFNWAFRPVGCYPDKLQIEMRKFPHHIRSALD